MSQGEWNLDHMPLDRGPSELVAMTFSQRARADEVLEILRCLAAESRIPIGDACTVTRDANGKVTLHQALATSPPENGPAVWTMALNGLLLVPLVGIVVAEATGRLRGGVVDLGVEEQFMSCLRARLQPGSSALFVSGRRVSERLLRHLPHLGEHMVRTALSTDIRRRLRATLRAGGN